MNNNYRSKGAEGTTPRFIPESRYLFHDLQVNPYSVTADYPDYITDTLPDPTKVTNR